MLLRFPYPIQVISCSVLSVSKESRILEYTDCLCLLIHYKISVLFWCLPFPKQSSLSLRLTFISWSQISCTYSIIKLNHDWFSNMPVIEFSPIQKDAKGSWERILSWTMLFFSPWICHIWMWGLILQHPSCNHEGSQPKVKSTQGMVGNFGRSIPSMIILVYSLARSRTHTC